MLRDTLGTIIFQDQVIEVAMAFAGFSPGEAEGLRRAMSRKRSAAAIESHHRRFVEGATARWDDVDEELAERVFAMIVGFSGFGFPKAHGAAFGLLAYQSTWLRVHYGPEFLAALLDEQPMGFYPPDALVHEAQRRGIAVHPPDVNASAAGAIGDSGGSRAPGPRTGARRARGRSRRARRRARDRRPLPLARGARLTRRRGTPRAHEIGMVRRCDRLPAVLAAVAVSSVARVPEARVAPCVLATDDDPPAAVGGQRGIASATRREALWRLACRLAASARGGTQLALPLGLPDAPRLDGLGSWEAMLADYATTGLTTAAHPLELLREGLRRDGAVMSDELGRIEHGTRVRVGGLVVARQRPGTASGIVFMLLEDELGTVNLIVPPPVYDRHRLVVRTEPLVVAEGILERFASGGGAVNVMVRRISPLETPGERAGNVREMSPADERDSAWAQRGEQEAVAAGAGFRAVAPPVMSFAQGRRR